MWWTVAVTDVSHDIRYNEVPKHPTQDDRIGSGGEKRLRWLEVLILKCILALPELLPHELYSKGAVRLVM
jgi:hypothetical protein